MIAADTCECLGDMTPEQSLTVLEMMCWEDQYLMQNYKFYNHTDVEKIGLVLIASKTRLGGTLTYDKYFGSLRLLIIQYSERVEMIFTKKPFKQVVST